MPARAALSPVSPAGLSVLRVAYGDVSQLGVFCTDPIAKGVRFGPFQGKVVNTSEIKTYDDNSLMWEVAEAPSGSPRTPARGRGEVFGVPSPAACKRGSAQSGWWDW